MAPSNAETTLGQTRPVPLAAVAEPSSAIPASSPSLKDTTRYSEFEVDDTAQGSAGSASRTGSASGAVGEDGRAEVDALPPVDRGKGAWLFCFVSFLLETFVWGFSSNARFRQTHDPWQKESIAALSAVGTTQLGIQFILPTFVVFFFRRYPEWVKPTLWVAVAVSCLSLLIASWATKVWQLILLFGIINGCANAVLFSPVWSWLSDWWVARRGLALGIVLSGIGVGGFAFPFLLDALLTHGGWPLLARVWAGLTAVVFSLAVWFIRPRVPPPPLALFRKSGERRERARWLAVDWRRLRDPLFLLMCLSSLLAGLSYLPVALYLPQYASSLTSSPTQQNLVLALFNLLAACGSFASGPVSDYDYTLTTVVCGLCGALTSLAAWATADSLGKVYAFGLLFAATGQMVSAWGGCAKSVTRDPTTSTLLFCLFSVVRGIASLCMPFVSEKLYDQAKAGERAAWGAFGFQKMIVFVGVTASCSALGGAAMWALRRKRGV
ncbi:hypothetical protein JCM8097_007232 [Rhodosporidiobolus ruineniae]